MDRGTAPMMPLIEFRHPPLDINDSDLTSADDGVVERSTGFTELTHAKLIHRAMLSQRKLLELSANATGTDWSHWPKMVAVVDDMRQHVESDLLKFKDTPGLLVKHHLESAPGILYSFELLLRRPPYRPFRNTVPPWENGKILEIATAVLEAFMEPISPELAPFAWNSWVQWHALAVVLAELLVLPNGALFDRAYAAAQKGFSYYTTLIADGDSGMLWKPIARLMHRVQRQHELFSQSAKPHSGLPTTVRAANSNDLLPREVPETSESFSMDTLNVQFDDTTLSGAAGFQAYEQLGDIHSTMDTQWLAWDCFLEDLNFPGV